MSSVVETVTTVVTPITDELKFEVVEVEFVKEGQNWFLRIYIDKPGGIDIEDCAVASEKISEALDAMNPDPIPQAYFLEVSSPGAERPLKKEEDFVNALEEYVHVSLYTTVEGDKQFNGYLKEVTPETLTLTVKIKTRDKDMTFERSNIAKARLAIKF